MIEKGLLAEVCDLIANRSEEGIVGRASNISPADWAAIIPALDPAEIATLVSALPEVDLPEILTELDPWQAAEILLALSRTAAASIIGSMEPDVATDVLESMTDEESDAVLFELAPEDASDLRSLLAFDPDSAAGIMTPEFIAVAPNVHVGQAISGLRRVARDGQPQSYVYVLDRDEHLVGVLPLHTLVFSAPDREISEIMVTDPIRVREDTPAESVARLLRDRNLMAVPVVDVNDRLLGVVTIDDAVDVLEYAIADDYLRQAGTDAEAMATRNPLQIARLRLPWLLGTMVIELGAGVVISRFDHVLTQVILLASFMPVISAVSGNVGLQSAAIVVRGLDTGHVQTIRWRRQLSRELTTTFVMAVACAITLGTVGALWSGHLPFGLVIGIALLCSMMTAGFMGTMIPMGSQKFGFDPATTAGPFETAFQDVVGFAVFLWLASLLVGYLQ